MTTAEAIARIREMLAKATPGVWMTGASPNCTPNTSCLSVWSHDKKFYEHKIVECVLVPDAELIAAAPTELARLCDALEVADQALAECSDHHTWCALTERMMPSKASKWAREARAEISRVLGGEGK